MSKIIEEIIKILKEELDDDTFEIIEFRLLELLTWLFLMGD